MKCHTCGKQMRYAKDLSFNGEQLSGYKCGCGEEYYDPEAAGRILLKSKLRTARLTAKLGRVRSNLILRLPKDVETALGLREGQDVTLRVEGETLTVGRA
jgi:hypothetical protein